MFFFNRFELAHLIHFFSEIYKHILLFNMTEIGK